MLCDTPPARYLAGSLCSLRQHPFAEILHDHHHNAASFRRPTHNYERFLVRDVACPTAMLFVFSLGSKRK